MMDEYDTLKAQAWIDKYKVTTSTHPQGALFKNIAQVRNPRLLSALKVDILKRGDSFPHSRWSSKVTRAPAIDSVLALIMPIAPPPMIKQSLIFSNLLLATMPHQQ
jgi:hypothetical protein